MLCRGALGFVGYLSRLLGSIGCTVVIRGVDFPVRAPCVWDSLEWWFCPVVALVLCGLTSTRERRIQEVQTVCVWCGLFLTCLQSCLRSSTLVLYLTSGWYCSSPNPFPFCKGEKSSSLSYCVVVRRKVVSPEITQDSLKEDEKDALGKRSGKHHHSKEFRREQRKSKARRRK